MRALEFKSIIKNNQILIPPNIQSAMKGKPNDVVRVIVLIEEVSFDENSEIQAAINKNFLKGYAESDSIYDEI